MKKTKYEKPEIRLMQVEAQAMMACSDPQNVGIYDQVDDAPTKQQKRVGERPLGLSKVCPCVQQRLYLSG
ncbi:hypothetical protein [Paraprevotella xylaniphila]|uniref:hypothetical protein n=1 Tax=Paraprevotella xylaniphila TaxID=454155 RepID=UPI0024A8B2CA|nr:hypothetical protein [Paraprevotella xylaniphila]